MKRPRHGYTKDGRTVAIMGRCYLCKIRNVRFQSIDESVIAQCNDYVKTMWERNGFDLSKRAAIKIETLQQLQTDLNQGLGVNPFHSSFIECKKRRHFHSAFMW